MILTNISLTDFGVFHGRQSASLAPLPGRPVILFGGKNGAGKSTLLEAIRLCLYGPRLFNTRISREEYLKYLESKIHSGAGCLIQPSFASVRLDFRYGDTDGLHAFSVTRSWERRGPHRVTEDLRVERDAKLLDDIASEHWQDFVLDLIPPGVSQLFFFDGEKIQQLAEDTTDQQTLAAAIKSLLGMDVVERLQADLSVYLSRLAKPSSNGQCADEMQELENDITRLTETINEAMQVRQKHEARLAELRTAIARLEEKIGSQGGSFARNRESLIQRQGELKALIRQHEDRIRDLSASLLPFALIPDLCSQLKSQLLSEEQALQAHAGRALLDAAQKQIAQRIQSHQVWADLPRLPGRSKAEIMERLARVVKEPLLEAAGPVQVIHELSGPDRRQLLSWIDQACREIPKSTSSSAAELERLYRDLQKIEVALRKIPPDDVLRPLMEELHGLYQELGGAGKLALVKDQEIKDCGLKLAELRRRYNNTAEKLAQQATHNSKIHSVPRIQNVLSEYRSALLNKKMTDLQGAVILCFNSLCRKGDVLRKITVDPNDFSVVLFDRQNRPLPKSQLSAGEKQIYAISMLWALAKTSRRALPMIIDTPLARLDSDHRHLLIRRYFPVASHQVLILSTDTEVDQSYFGALRPAVARSYRLEFDPEESGSTIRPEYFWGTRHEAHKTPTDEGSI